MQSENSFDDIFPDGNWIINVLLGQSQANIGGVILPFLRLFWFPDTETKSPGDTHSGFGKEVGRGQGVVPQLGGLDIRFDSGEIDRLSPDGTTVLLFHVLAATNDDGLGAVHFVHSDLANIDQKHLGKATRNGKKLTENKEQEDAQ